MSKEAAGHQPPPKPGRERVTPIAVEILKEREIAGTRKYGTALMTFNGRDAEMDALQEAADNYVYQVQAIKERETRIGEILSYLDGECTSPCRNSPIFKQPTSSVPECAACFYRRILGMK